MSWSVQSSGTAAEVAARAESSFRNSGPCSEPEESIRQKARELIAQALAAQKPDTTKVTLSAYGSQSSYCAGETERLTNTLKIEIAVDYS